MKSASEPTVRNGLFLDDIALSSARRIFWLNSLSMRPSRPTIKVTSERESIPESPENMGVSSVTLLKLFTHFNKFFASPFFNRIFLTMPYDGFSSRATKSIA